MGVVQSSASVVIPRNDIAGLKNQTCRDAAKTGHVALKIFRPEGVDAETGVYWYKKSQSILQRANTATADGAAPRRIQTQVSSGSYTVAPYRLEHPVTRRQKARFQASFDAQAAAFDTLYDVIERECEVRCLAKINATAFSGHTSGASVEWTDPVNSKPCTDMNTAISAIELASGRKRHELSVVMHPEICSSLGVNEQIRLKLGAAYNDAVNLAQKFESPRLAEIFGVKEVLLAAGRYNGNNEANATVSPAYIWDKDNVLVYVSDDAPAEDSLSFAKTFFWNQMDGLFTADQYEEPQTDSIVARAGMDVTEDVLNYDCAYLLTAINT